MRLVLFTLTLVLLFSSCKKDNDGGGRSQFGGPIFYDTLTTGWSKIIIPGETTGFSDIFFVQNTGFVILGNKIRRSTNGGTDWSLVYTSNQQLINIGMGSTSNAIFVINSGKIIFTTNGGNSFDSTTIADTKLTDVFFVNSSTAYAAGNSFWKTTNGGASWTKVSDFSTTGGAGVEYRILHFINDQAGWANSYNGLFKTTNGGSNWQPVLPAPPLAPGLNTANAVFFTDASNGYMSTTQKIIKTTNAGTNWVTIYDETPAYSGYIDIHFIDNNTGYYSSRLGVFKTTDAGATWTRVAKLGYQQPVEMHFTDATHGWICCSGGVILKYSL